MSEVEVRAALKTRLQKREKLFAGWTSLGHPQITEILCRAGFDLIGIDIEHSTISQAEAQRIIAASHANGVACLPRIASHNKEMARRLLDSGADGLIVPTVETAEDVRAVIDWMKYPPVGKRGFGVARAQGYGFDFEAYTATWNDSSILIVQIESIQAVQNINEILSFPEVDGVMVGPYDISGSLKVPGQLDHPSVVEAGLEVVKACAKAGKSCGNQIIDPSAENMKEFFGRDYTFAVLASDIFALWKWSERMRGLMGRA